MTYLEDVQQSIQNDGHNFGLFDGEEVTEGLECS